MALLAPPMRADIGVGRPLGGGGGPAATTYGSPNGGVGGGETRSVHFAEHLASAGAVVRNTFIDIPVPEDGDSQRSSSVPASMRLAKEADPDPEPDSPDFPIVRRRSSRNRTMPAKSMSGIMADLNRKVPERQLSAASLSSTASSEGHRPKERDKGKSSACEEAEPWRFAAEQLARLVMKECGFMRVRTFWVSEERNGRARRRHSVAALVR
eukprot:CAMPEP_0195120122 /NCGR_PEP_ID=MMETSP0448-20130528/121124_1 /TAXON_ID=66468 /ORGANISM="Heterocapsa triquestra, Strain CCMP 448" /LENGTH=210 /DNA_ID=CAMNT_0040157513 /DNA_START=44 /DNA_END=672 /DNA_ORIENTATION=+